tara:strand:+ start:2484 stop:2957 length:474 start_codon:yes stop_codon:yes gene_type:complete
MITQEDIDAMQPEMPHEKVGTFMKAFGASLDPRMWVKLVDEEMSELSAETPGTAAHLKELCDVLYVSTGLALTAPEHIGMLLPVTERKAIVTQQAQVSSVLKENLEQYGDSVFTEAFNRVHDSNMSKLGLDGKPIYRQDGKVLKGPNYRKPDLEDLI